MILNQIYAPTPVLSVVGMVELIFKINNAMHVYSQNYNHVSRYGTQYQPTYRAFILHMSCGECIVYYEICFDKIVGGSCVIHSASHLCMELYTTHDRRGFADLTPSRMTGRVGILLVSHIKNCILGVLGAGWYFFILRYAVPFLIFCSIV